MALPSHGYALFEPCTVDQRRGVRAVCGFCHNAGGVRMNSFPHTISDETIERKVARKFENLGWKIGKSAKDNRCPKCIKASAEHKEREKHMGEKVVLITPAPKAEPPVTPPREMSRDERRIIFNKIDENYVGEKVGYAAGWSDARVATDLGVPRAWVAHIRDENFGADIDEQHTQTVSEAKALLNDIKAFQAHIAPFTERWRDLTHRSDAIEHTLAKLLENKSKK